MTSTLILILNIVLDVAILGLLAFVMTRPAKLTPHGPVEAVPAASRQHAEREHARARARGDRAASPLRPLLD